MSLIEALLLAVVEGLTEYLPISSTGHLVLTSALFGIHEVGVVKHYMIIVQFGAILAVVFEYFRWIKSHTSFFPRLMVGFIPAAVVALAVKSYIDALLSHVLVVAIALILGGIVLLFTDRFFERQKDKSESHLGHVTMKQSFLVGVFQCLAFVPGVSRAGASIWGGAFAGMNKKVATEFSFLLAVPTLTAASGYKLMKAWPELSMDDLNLFLIGNVVSFIVGWITIRFFIQMVVKHGFKFFGYYRIVLGSIVVAVWAMGMISA
ncbi:MAG TPA: UDP-diphosphatase [Bdellovibrionales bacterium]|nr:UDP-diphosphatase [Bdellovibrionales bacterium]